MRFVSVDNSAETDNCLVTRHQVSRRVTPFSSRLQTSFACRKLLVTLLLVIMSFQALTFNRRLMQIDLRVLRNQGVVF